jgi:hypothetical protein
VIADPKGAARARNYRRRLKEGRLSVRIEVPLAVIDDLVARGYLSEADADDPRQIEAAVQHELNDRARPRVEKNRHGVTRTRADRG